MKTHNVFFTARRLASFIALLLFTSISHAETVTFSLENIFTTAGERMTGRFDWTYDSGDFENGSGQFTEIYIPRYGTDLSLLDITIDLTSIEFTLAGNFHSTEVDINLNLLTPLSLTDSSFIDVSSTGGVYESKFSVFGFGHMPYEGGFLFGQIDPVAVVNPVPLPSAGLLFAPGLVLMGITAFRKSKTRL